MVGAFSRRPNLILRYVEIDSDYDVSEYYFWHLTGPNNVFPENHSI